MEKQGESSGPRLRNSAGTARGQQVNREIDASGRELEALSSRRANNNKSKT